MLQNNLIRGQVSLFEPEPLFDTQIYKEIDGYDVLTSYGKEGSYIDTSERAGHLISALNAISQRNIRDGISLAVYTEEYSAPIWASYKAATPSVIDGASRNRDKYQQKLRLSFWGATGFAALRGSGLLPESQINPRAQKMWRDFNKDFGHPDKLKARNDYKKELHNQVRSETGNNAEIAA